MKCLRSEKTKIAVTICGYPFVVIFSKIDRGQANVPRAVVTYPQAVQLVQATGPIL